MLRNLHVKNLALIDEMEVEFEEGLNILTGETGAGKSLIIGLMISGTDLNLNLIIGAQHNTLCIQAVGIDRCH